jgi:transposase-like protein
MLECPSTSCTLAISAPFSSALVAIVARSAWGRVALASMPSATVEEAELQLDAFARKWDEQLPTISKSWRLNWERLTPFMSYPPEIRRVIYTTNVIESVNS